MHGTLGDVACWGADDRSGDSTRRQDGRRERWSDGAILGVKLNGEIVCWGNMDYGFGVFPDPPVGNFEKVAIGGDFLSAAVRSRLQVDRCWGSNDQGQLDAPAGLH